MDLKNNLETDFNLIWIADTAELNRGCNSFFLNLALRPYLHGTIRIYFDISMQYVSYFNFDHQQNEFSHFLIFFKKMVKCFPILS